MQGVDHVLEEHQRPFLCYARSNTCTPMWAELWLSQEQVFADPFLYQGREHGAGKTHHQTREPKRVCPCGHGYRLWGVRWRDASRIVQTGLKLVYLAKIEGRDILGARLRAQVGLRKESSNCS